ncbi:RNA polymerase sigma factor [Fulvivirgaceae bacterium BMA12]|uniref:RNA polymerase sigma factor n=1 Tax=Agaribacillus aureus TaxID=3051825 RepID=A0ABT8LAI3_9BACT|nr:RNA polymerase sigma factor [Fulvivirgaceae bacterium BMA12]
MNSPFNKRYKDFEDKALIKQSLAGDKKALEMLVGRHQPYIYNFAWKMCGNPDDASDISQEVLIKVITNLSRFRQNSSFRTWLYRITINHFLDMKKSAMEARVMGFEEYGNNLENIPNVELTSQELIELDDQIKDAQYRCMSGMLLCLTREQRIAYVLGDIFGADHHVGATLLGITPSNYRMRLSRARKDLHSFMDHKCGLVNKANPCRCRKKVTFAIENGFVDPNNLQFNLKNQQRIKTVINPSVDSFGEYYNNKYSELQCEMPFDNSSKPDIFKKILGNKEVQKLLNL